MGCFWLLPFSPVLAIGAVARTGGATGRPRRLAVSGAVLRIGYTVVMTLLVARLAWQAW